MEEILHGLDLPATGEPEDNLAAPPDEYDRGSTEEDEEPAEESAQPRRTRSASISGRSAASTS